MKCVVMHFGHNNNTHYFSATGSEDMGITNLQSVIKERDFGIVISGDLKFS